jgi:hypothetical protein
LNRSGYCSRASSSLVKSVDNSVNKWITVFGKAFGKLVD